ncbi:MAG: putative molybdenum carrier protein, partial [Actinomycetia bacterium]|nr:putative molybdenum carrier protein [Actinomycetes bacterium]
MNELGSYEAFVNRWVGDIFDHELTHRESLLNAAYDAIRPDFDNKIRQIQELLLNDPMYQKWLTEHSVTLRQAQDLIDAYAQTRDVGMLMGGSPSTMFEKLVALADARAGIELTPGAGSQNSLTHISSSTFVEMTAKQLGDTLKNLGVAGRSKARTKSARLARLDDLFFGEQPPGVETVYLKQAPGDRMANTAVVKKGDETIITVQIHLPSIFDDYDAGLAYLRGTSDLAVATEGRAADAMASIGVDIDHLQAWFEHNGGKWAYADFVRYHEYVHASDPQNWGLVGAAKEMHANTVALRSVGYDVADAQFGAPLMTTLDITTKGEPFAQQFSAMNARLTSRGGRTIEDIYQHVIKGSRKGAAPVDKTLDLETAYTNLWREWADENPALFQEITQKVLAGTRLTDQFSPNGTAVRSQARSIQRIIWERNELPWERQLEIISGGQIGADQMGLEVATELGLRTRGTAPKNFKTSKGSDPNLKAYGLVEDSAPTYPPRTEKNVLNSDGTVVYGSNVNSPGTKLTRNLANQHGKPYIENPSPQELAQFLDENNITVLNVAGNRSYTDSTDFYQGLRTYLGGDFPTSQSGDFVVPTMKHAEGTVRATSTRGKNAVANEVNVGRATSGGVDQGRVGNRYVVQYLNEDGTLSPTLPDTNHPTFTQPSNVTPGPAVPRGRGFTPELDEMGVPIQRRINPATGKPRGGMVIPPKQLAMDIVTDDPAPYIGIVVGIDAPTHKAANRIAVEGYANDIDRAITRNPEFGSWLIEQKGKVVRCPGSHKGMCHADIVADRINKLNNLPDPSDITHNPQVTRSELADRMAMARNAMSQKFDTVNKMSEKFDNLLTTSRLDGDGLVAKMGELQAFGDNWNEAGARQILTQHLPEMRELVATLRPGAKLQVIWETDPASKLRRPILRIVAPGDEAILMGGKKADITAMVDDIVAGKMTREQAITAGYPKAVVAADIKQSLLDSVGAVAEFMQSRLQTKAAKYYPQRRLISQFDVMVKFMNEATATGNTGHLRQFMGEFLDDGSFKPSVAWRNIEHQLEMMAPERAQQLRWWVDVALAMDGWDNMAAAHAWHEGQMQVVYNAGHSRVKMIEMMNGEIEKAINGSVWLTPKEHQAAIHVNQRAFNNLQWYTDVLGAPRMPLEDAKAKIIEGIQVFEAAKRETKLNAHKDLMPEHYADVMAQLDDGIEGLRKTLQNLPENSIDVGVPAGYQPASKLGFDESLLADASMDPLFAEAMSITNQHARLLFTPYGMSEISQSMNVIVGLWKRWATVINPAFHARNAVGGVANGWMIGVKPTDYLKWGPMVMKWRKGMKAVEQGDLTPSQLEDVLHRAILQDIPVEHHQMFKEAMETGTLGSSFARAEDLVSPSGHMSISPLSPDFVLYQVGGRVMEGMEDVMRLTAFAKHYDKGADTAAALVKMVHFDYSDLTAFEQQIKKIIPFYVWTRNNVPLQIRTMLESPGYFRKYDIIRTEWNQEMLRRESDDDRRAWGEYFATEGWLTPWRRG